MTLGLLLSTTACSTNTARNAGCDFVKGAGENNSERKERESAPGNEMESRNNDVEVGLLSAIFGFIVRPFFDDEEC
ncbi:hypothetical protein FJ709_00790 [Shewanella glacialimarina]|nr:hypothetical protein FJ709_00790 [Shewanella glacialimarina]